MMRRGHDADAPLQLGRAVYFMLPSRQAARYAGEAFAGLPALWIQVTRGDSGWFRCEQQAPNTARVDGAAQTVGSKKARSSDFWMESAVSSRPPSVRCTRRGDPFCTLEVTWNPTERLSKSRPRGRNCHESDEPS